MFYITIFVCARVCFHALMHRSRFHRFIRLSRCLFTCWINSFWNYLHTSTSKPQVSEHSRFPRLCRRLAEACGLCIALCDATGHVDRRADPYITEHQNQRPWTLGGIGFSLHILVANLLDIYYCIFRYSIIYQHIVVYSFYIYCAKYFIWPRMFNCTIQLFAAMPFQSTTVFFPFFV